MMKRWVTVVLVLAALAHAETPPQGTFYGVNESSPHTPILYVYEEGLTCTDFILSFSHHLKLAAMVPVYVPQKPGETRVFVLGDSGFGRELWYGNDARILRNQVNIKNPISLTPFSDGEVMVLSGAGDIDILDHQGRSLHTYHLRNWVPRNLSPIDIGEPLRAWRPGPTSVAVLTTNYFVHYNATNPTVIALNNTVGGMGDRGTVVTALGDDKEVWIAHDGGLLNQMSFSLYELKSGHLVQQHDVPFVSNSARVQPVHVNEATGVTYFACDDELIAVNQFRVGKESPSAQMTPAGIGRGVRPLGPLVVTQPVRGMPWGSSSGAWLIPKAGTRGVLATVAPSASDPTPAPTPVVKEEKKMKFGVERTKKEFEIYLREVLAGAIVDVMGCESIAAAKLPSTLSRATSELRTAFNGLRDSFLEARGLVYTSGRLACLDDTKKSPFSAWVDELWKQD